MVRLPFVPKEQKFSELFEESAQNIVKASQALKEMVDSWQFIDSRAAEITELEHQGDTITHQILSLLNRTFVTPFDREDIALLAHTIRLVKVAPMCSKFSSNRSTGSITGKVASMVAEQNALLSA